MTEKQGKFEKGNQIGKETRFKPGHAMSRKYKPSYPESLVEYGRDCVEKGIPPLKEEWASQHHVDIRSLFNWVNEYPHFSAAMHEFEGLQKGDLIRNGLLGRYNPQIVKFLLSANHGMSEKAVNDTTVTYKIEVEDTIDEESN
jgi:hypothetical protein